jgi:glycine cleavage system aminomethyltransferase T
MRDRNQWAAMSLAEPSTRDVIARGLPEVDFGPMQLAHGRAGRHVSDVWCASVLRLSFSGEAIYEVHATHFGQRAWEITCLNTVFWNSASPYGLEALPALRIGAGLPQMDGRTIAGRSGMARCG